MADNVNITPGSGAIIAADEVPAASGIFFQRVKPTFGADGTAVDQAIAAAGIPKVGSTDSLGQVQYNFPAGFVRTSDEPRQLFYDPFDTFDTTDRWNAATASGGGVAAAVSAGVLTLGSGTTASGISYIGSRPSFTPTVPAWLGTSFAISLENPLGNNASRFWGVGSSPGTPTSAIPITDGYGFEIDTTGTLNAVVFAGGTRTVVSALTAPGDTASHRYIIYYRTDRIFWYVDSLTTPVATSNFQGPQIQTLPIKMSAVAQPVTGPGASRVISCTGLATWDTGKNNTTLSDGTFGWRKATVTSTGGIGVAGYNGTSFDAARTIQGVAAGANTDLGVLASGIGPGYDRIPATTSISAVNANALVVNTQGAANVSIDLGGTFTGLAASIEGSVDGTNYVVLPNSYVYNITTGPSFTNPVATTSTVTRLFVNCASLQKIRVNVTAIASGTVVIQAVAGPMPPVTSYVLTSPSGASSAQVKGQQDAYTNASGLTVGAMGYVYNGATFDMAREATADALAATGMPANGLMAYNGATWDRVRVAAKGTQGANGISTQNLKDAGRNVTNYFMAAGIAGTTTDTLMSLTGYKSNAAVAATTTPAVVTTGKTYRVQAITLTYQSLSTAGAARVSLRANTSGVVAIGSPLVLQHTIGSVAAVVGLVTTEQVDVPDGLEFAAGTGIGISQIGLGTAATALASGFLTVTITGYEY